METREEYRRQLELQVKEAQEKKERLKQERLQYESQNTNKDVAELIAESNRGVAVRRGQSDIMKKSVPESDDKI